MVRTAVASDVPAWLAAVLVAITGIGALANALSGIIGGIFQVRRLEQMDRERTAREVAQHQEVMRAINGKQNSP